MHVTLGNFELIMYRWGVCFYYDWRHLGWNSTEGFFLCVLPSQQDIS